MKQNDIIVLFDNKITLFFLYFMMFSLNLQMCQIILPDPHNNIKYEYRKAVQINTTHIMVYFSQ